MKNYDTPNMEFLHQYSIPEDRALLFRADGSTITKVWDTSGHSFQIPSASELNMLGYFPAYRAGAYNSGGDSGFELYEENAAKTSWWTPNTRTLTFVKIVSTASRLATQVNIETGALIGAAKPYVVIGNGSFHGTPEATENDIHFAIDLVTSWAIVISGYGSVASTKTSLFAYKDVDMQLALDLDTQGNLVTARLNYAGIWFGVHKLWYPGITENPILTNKYWYYPTLIGVNATRAVFLYLARSEIYNVWTHMGLKEFTYATKLWAATPSPVIAGDPALTGAVQVQFNDYPFMMTLTTNNNLYMVWRQFQTYMSGGWKSDWDVVARKMTNGVWGTATTLLSGTSSGMYPNLGSCGGSFNNNDYGFAYYFNTSYALVARLYTTGTWGSASTLSATADFTRPILFAKTESNNNRHYIAFRDGSVDAFYASVEAGAGWTTTQIDNASTQKYYWPQFTLVDDAQKMLVSWQQHNTDPSWNAWYTRFYSSAGWDAAPTLHEAITNQLFGLAQLGQAYNGTTAIIAMLGFDFDLGTGVVDQGLWVDRWNGSTWDGVTLLESLTNYVSPNEAYDHDLELPCYIDSSNNIYIAYCKIDSSTPANNFVKVAYYKNSTSTWSTTTLNTTPNKNVYMCGSGDRVLIAWEQDQQVYACLGEAGAFTTPKRISYYNPAADYNGTTGVVPDTNYIPPLLAMYGGQYLAMMCYSRNRYFAPDTYDYYFGEKEAVIANTGIFTP